MKSTPTKAAGTKRHVSSQYDRDLKKLDSLLTEMTEVVGEQLRESTEAMIAGDAGLASQVTKREMKVNELDVKINRLVSEIIALRQPAAIDLRLLVAILKIAGDYERIGDESCKVAHYSKEIAEILPERENMAGAGAFKHYCQDILSSYQSATALLKQAADPSTASAGKDSGKTTEQGFIDEAVKIFALDDSIDQQFEDLTRQFVSHMIEEPRTVPLYLKMLWSARSLERIADHCKNFCEAVVFIICGHDVSHFVQWQKYTGDSRSRRSKKKKAG